MTAIFQMTSLLTHTVYPKKFAHGFVVLCFVVVMQSFIMNSHEVFIHIHQGCFAGTGAIVRLPQCQWSKPDGYGKISQCITTTKHSKAKTVCIFLGIYCTCVNRPQCVTHKQTYHGWLKPLYRGVKMHNYKMSGTTTNIPLFPIVLIFFVTFIWSRCFLLSCFVLHHG